jgi:hypothetical protein
MWAEICARAHTDSDIKRSTCSDSSYSCPARRAKDGSRQERARTWQGAAKRRSRREIHERYLSAGAMTEHDKNLRSGMMSTSEHFHSAVVQRRASGSSSLRIDGTCATVAAHIVPPEAGGEGVSGNLEGVRCEGA